MSDFFFPSHTRLGRAERKSKQNRPPKRQFELAGASEVFNLAGQSADDPFRLQRESWEAAEREREGREYAARMQRGLELCPGFMACDAPTCDDGRGKVVVEPGRIVEALAWLKRRFRASQNIELSAGDGIAVEIAPRQRRSQSGGRKVKVSFGKPVQFEFKI